MKNILSYLLIILLAIAVTSCKNEQKDNTATDAEKEVKSGVSLVSPKVEDLSSDTLLAMITNMTKINPAEVAPMKRAAEAIINHRQKISERKSHIILDNHLWEFEFIFSGRKMSAVNQLAGYWIDFAEDLTYTYGLNQEVLGSGRYTFSLDTGLLLMIDNSDAIKPQEFAVNITDQTLILDGNDIYRDNNYNAKLKRITERPNKAN